MKQARDKLEAVARKFSKEYPGINDYGYPSDEQIFDFLLLFAKAVRRQTLREERSRNKRVAKMFEPKETH